MASPGLSRMGTRSASMQCSISLCGFLPRCTVNPPYLPHLPLRLCAVRRQLSHALDGSQPCLFPRASHRQSAEQQALGAGALCPSSATCTPRSKFWGSLTHSGSTFSLPKATSHAICLTSHVGQSHDILDRRLVRVPQSPITALLPAQPCPPGPVPGQMGTQDLQVRKEDRSSSQPSAWRDHTSMVFLSDLS